MIVRLSLGNFARQFANSHQQIRKIRKISTNLFQNAQHNSSLKSNNVFLNSGSNLYKFSQGSQQFVFNYQTQPQLLNLQLQYRSQQNAAIFEKSIKQSTNLLDQMNIYKIFKVMEQSTFNYDAYQLFYNYVQNSIKRKSDNMLLLLATAKERISKAYRREKQYPQALQCLEQALDILERSMVPPLFAYYSIYRQYGILHFQLGQKQKAKQILIQSVDILDDFVSHSDDNVSTNEYCKKQATACNALAQIDSQNKSKWISKAHSMWEKFTQDRFKQIEYAKTVAENFKKQLQEDKQKGQAYYHFNMYKFQAKQMKEILKKAKQQAEKAKN